MKRFVLIIVMGGLCLFLNAQSVVEKRASIKSGQELEMNFKFADDIKISSWDKNEVYVKVTYSINDGKHNDKFELIMDKRSDGVKFKSKIYNLKDISYKEIIQDDESDNVHISHRVDLDFKFEVFVPKGVKIQSETIDGNYEIKGISNEMKIKSISGDVDVHLAQKATCDVELSTISGEMYSDFDIQKSDKEMFSYGPSNVEFELNGGGNYIELHTISGDIFLRKQ